MPPSPFYSGHPAHSPQNATSPPTPASHPPPKSNICINETNTLLHNNHYKMKRGKKNVTFKRTSEHILFEQRAHPTSIRRHALFPRRPRVLGRPTPETESMRSQLCRNICPMEFSRTK